MEPSTPSRHSRPHSSHSSWTTDSWVSSFADLGSTSPPPDSSPTSYCTTPTRAVRSSKALTASSPISLTPQKHQGRHEVPPTSQHLSPYASRNGSLISRAPTKAPGAHISFSIPLDAQLPPSRTPSRRLVRTGSYTAGLSASTLPMRMPSNESMCKFPSDFEDSSSDENDERARSRLATSSSLLVSSTQASLPPPSTPLPLTKSKQHASRHDAASSAALALQQMAHTASLPYFGRHGSNTSRSSTATSTVGYVSSTSVLPSNERSSSNSIFRRQASANRTSSGATSSRDAVRSSPGATVFHSTRRPPPTQISSTKRPPSPSHDLTGYEDGSPSKRPRPQQTQARPAHRALKPLFGRGAPAVPGPSSRTRAQIAAAPQRDSASTIPFEVPVARRKLTVKPSTLPQASEVASSASSARREPAPTQASLSNESHSSREERARRRRDDVPASFPALTQPDRSAAAAQPRRLPAPTPAPPFRAPVARRPASTAAASTGASSSTSAITPPSSTQSSQADPRRVNQFPGFYRRYRVPCHLPSSISQQVYTTSITAAASSTNNSSTSNTTQAAYTRSLATLRIPRRFSTVASAPIVSNADYDDPFNLYTPRFVRGRGQDKLGLCPLCFEEDDGQGDQTWHRTKVSAYNYHIQMHHGISFMTGKPFDPPTRYRDVEMEVTISGSTVKKTMPQGLCHACGKWIDLDSVKPVAVKIPEVYFRKHAVQCHKGREREHSDPHDYLIKDDFYHRVAQAVRDSS